MVDRNNVREEFSHKAQNSCLSSTRSTPIESFFSGLRSLARRVETEVANMGQHIDSFQSNPNSCDADGMHAKHFMQLERKEMETLKSNVHNLHDDLKMRSSTVVSASELLTSLLESYSDRLESVETFMEKYGYVRPDLQMEEQESLCDAKENQEFPGSVENEIQSDAENENVCISGVSTPPPCTTEDYGEKRLNTPHTPRLEDFGLSEYTLSLYTRRQQKEESNTFANKFHPLPFVESASKTTCQNEQQCSLSDTITSDSNTPVCSKLREVSINSSSTHSEMHTPQPEDFGLSDHLLLRERPKINFEKTLFLGNGDEIMDMNSPSSKFTHTLAQKDLTPKLEKNISFFHSEQTLPFIGMEKKDKENITQRKSPKMPETLDHYSAKNIIESMPSSVASSSTPEYPKLQIRDIAATETCFLSDVVSAASSIDRTPPLPVLSAFK